MGNNAFEVIKKRSNFTMVDNLLIQDKTISWKAKGIMTYLLSLPDTYVNEQGKIKKWIISRKNIVNSSKDGETCVNSAIRELRKNGYIVLCRYIDKNNKTLGWRYKVFEEPLKDPIEGHQILTINNYDGVEEPDCDFPDVVLPDVENNQHINTNISKINVINNQSINQNETYEEIDRLKQQIYQNISYDILCETTNKDLVDELVTIMIDTISSNKEFVKISNLDISFSVVKDRLLQINDSHIEYVIDCFKQNKTNVHSIKSYLLACLYNAPATINSYFTAKVNHDLYGKQQ